MPGKPPFKQLTKTQYEALAPDRKLDYLASAIEARTEALYVPDPPPQRRKRPLRKPLKR